MPAVLLVIIIAGFISLLALLFFRKSEQLKGGITFFMIMLVASLSLSQNLRTTALFWLKQNDYTSTLRQYISEYRLFFTDATTEPFLWVMGLFLPALTFLAFYFRNIGGKQKLFHFWLLVSVVLSVLILLSANLFLILFLWGATAIPLYLLVNEFNSISAKVAKRTLILFGSAHGIMITGVAIVVFTSSSSDWSQMKLEMSSWTTTLAFYMILCGGLVKMGVFPFHSWLADYCKSAPTGASVLLPLFLEKITGAYLVIRLLQDIFIVGDPHRILLIILACLTMLLAIALGITQTNHSKITGYVSVFSSGFLLLMIVGTPLPVAELSVFLLIVNTTGLVALLLAEHWMVGKKSSDLHGKTTMPVFGESGLFFIKVLIIFTLFSVPPMGSFVILPIVFQHFIESFAGASRDIQTGMVLLVLLVIACKGLVLAQLFLHNKRLTYQKQKSSPINTLPNDQRVIVFSMAVLVLLSISMNYLYFFSGWFNPGLTLENAALPNLSSSSWIISLVYLAIIPGAGKLFYSYLNKDKVRLITFLKPIERNRYTDIYELVSGVVLAGNRVLSRLHDGILQTYLVWVMVTMILLFFLFQGV